MKTTNLVPAQEAYRHALAEYQRMDAIDKEARSTAFQRETFTDKNGTRITECKTTVSIKKSKGEQMMKRNDGIIAAPTSSSSRKDPSSTASPQQRPS